MGKLVYLLTAGEREVIQTDGIYAERISNILQNFARETDVFKHLLHIHCLAVFIMSTTIARDVAVRRRMSVLETVIIAKMDWILVVGKRFNGTLRSPVDQKPRI